MKIFTLHNLLDDGMHEVIASSLAEARTRLSRTILAPEEELALVL